MKRTTASGSVSGAYVDRDAGSGTAGTKNIAEDRNLTQEEICHPIEDAGFTLDGTDSYQLERSIIAMSRKIGEIIESEIPLTQTILSASRSSANPSYPEYSPIIERNADKDITTTQAPDLVTAYRSVKASVAGVSSWTVTVSGSTVTFGSDGDKLLALLVAESQAAFWLNNSQAASIGNDYATSTTRRCINIAGTDYNYTAVSTGSRTITVDGTPTSGSQTCYVYTYRVVGYTDRVRLPKLCGFVGVSAGDSDGEVVEGWRRMDRFEGHWHQNRRVSGTGSLLVMPNTGSSTYAAANSVASAESEPIYASTIVSDTVNTIRTGKTTDPRTHGRRIYTFARRLLATA